MGCLTGCLGLLLIVLGIFLLVGEVIGWSFGIAATVISAFFGGIAHIIRAIFR
ncbi:MAG: hypothetical protein IMF26_09945 [Candidatus Fermentithermobacillus carboniphilus]|uniref:Uncharacterized protein n=1 Tax=Candidatus Fermentithermobacillus carboniphilus TaxID=3085328 RepID=A0AAT9LB15_9FIRM|nr:MAG: hypothetical protein IMF26_09945 [Candidatus Fermentithermobacillus carboniphilus]